MNRLQRAEFMSDLLHRLDMLPQAWGFDELESEGCWLVSVERAKACVAEANRTVGGGSSSDDQKRVAASRRELFGPEHESVMDGVDPEDEPI